MSSSTSGTRGPEVKALKTKLWSPESFAGGLLERNYASFCLLVALEFSE